MTLSKNSKQQYFTTEPKTITATNLDFANLHP